MRSFYLTDAGRVHFKRWLFVFFCHGGSSFGVSTQGVGWRVRGGGWGGELGPLFRANIV